MENESSGEAGNIARTCQLINFLTVNSLFFLVFSCIQVSDNDPNVFLNNATCIYDSVIAVTGKVL